MFDGTYYLNNSGDKWIVTNPSVRGKLDRSPMDFYLVTEEGNIVKRRADYYEMCGNFATVSFRIKGIRFGGFFDDWSKINGLPVLRHYSQQMSKIDRLEGKTQKIVKMDDMEYKEFHSLYEKNTETMFVSDNDPYQIDKEIIIVAETTRPADWHKLYLCLRSGIAVK